MSLPNLARRFSPRHQRWERLLRSLTFDPSSSVPLETPGSRDFFICGLPRSGTSLLCAALFQPPSCVTVMEPWDAMRFPPAELFTSLREEIAEGELRRGRLDVEELRRTGGVMWGRDGEYPNPVVASIDHLLGVKLPAYWRLLDLITDTKFLVCVRHPVEVVTSFSITGGRLAQGLDYESAINREMNDYLSGATEDVELRRLLFFEYVVSRITPHLCDSNVFVVRYERWFEDRERLMSDIARFLEVDLGPGLPLIRAPRSRPLDARVARLIEEHCPSAAALGYDVRTPAR